MGRKRSKNHHLPPHMAQKESSLGISYYYVYNSPRRREPLGNDLDKARRLWANIEAGGARQGLIGNDAGLTVGQLVQRHIDREDRPAGTLSQYKSTRKRLLDLSWQRSKPAATSRLARGQWQAQVYCNGCIAPSRRRWSDPLCAKSSLVRK
jgi:hypothetical protein